MPREVAASVEVQVPPRHEMRLVPDARGEAMTDSELRNAAVAHLRATTISYPDWLRRVSQGRYTPSDGSGTHWGQALSLLARIGATPPPVTGALPKAGISTGASILAWDAAKLDRALSRMREISHGKPFAVRFDAGDNPTCDRVTQAVLNHGLVPYLVLYGTTNPRALDGQPKALAARWRGTSVVFTGPNEPDLHGWTADGLADFQKGLYEAVKGANPETLCGGPALWKGGAGPQAYVRSLCTRAKGKFDFLSFHGYDDPTVHAWWDVWDYWLPGGYYTEPDTCTGILTAAGISVPIVNDESGFKGDDQAQAARVKLLLDQYGRVAMNLIFSWYSDYDPGWQVVRDDNSERPAVKVISDWMAAH